MGVSVQIIFLLTNTVHGLFLSNTAWRFILNLPHSTSLIAWEINLKFTMESTAQVHYWQHIVQKTLPLVTRFVLQRTMCMWCLSQEQTMAVLYNSRLVIKPRTQSQVTNVNIHSQIRLFSLACWFIYTMCTLIIKWSIKPTVCLLESRKMATTPIFWLVQI